ncbi:flagellar motor switch protein FliM [Chengkuizengella axinellae]|uniref:Flagellar motor switch protein FliM n=1 Tax=Chengkuizengella axinellae TaxID=3064388 RepID=A0ABT9IXB6_9BACL|nr:flagellar motor switch protein FliM [Chengkuizengella sp. 2205SS18-9]MDP5273449.1 flagellar motor switch protein FliM [Chengkuizengella sp. 2205SS18-9]
MVDILSQNEIDALLTALSSGEMDAEELKKEESEKKVRVYDFKRAVRFSKDHIRSLSRIHENFARYLTTYFSAQLRTFMQIKVVQVEQLPYDEFIRSIPKSTILNIFEAEPLKGRMVLEVHPNIAYAMIDRLLGGVGTNPSNVTTLTEIETMVLERIFTRAFDSFKEAWKSVIDVTPKLTALETNPQFIQIVSPNETIALISMRTNIGEFSGMMNLCIPHVVIEPIMSRLSDHHWFISEKKAEKNPIEIEALKRRLHNTSLPIVAKLGSSNISVHEFLNIVEGDVIKLDKTIHDGLVISVGNKEKFIGRPGEYNGKLAIKVEEIISEEEGENE